MVNHAETARTIALHAARLVYLVREHPKYGQSREALVAPRLDAEIDKPSSQDPMSAARSSTLPYAYTSLHAR